MNNYHNILLTFAFKSPFCRETISRSIANLSRGSGDRHPPHYGGTRPLMDKLVLCEPIFPFFANLRKGGEEKPQNGALASLFFTHSTQLGYYFFLL